MHKEHLEAKYGIALNKEEFEARYEGLVMIGDDRAMAYNKEGVIKCKLDLKSGLFYDIRPVKPYQASSKRGG